MLRPDVRKYADFRTFLKDWTLYSQSRNPRWSYGVWARKMGLSSKSSLIMILNGSRNPGPHLTKRLLRSLELDSDEADHFKKLVAIQKSNLQGFFRILVEKPAVGPAPGVGLPSRWLMLVFRELVTFPEYEETPEYLSRKLGFEITAAQFELALKFLIREGLLERAPSGRLVLGSAGLPTPWQKDEVRAFHREGSDAGARAFEATPTELRGFHSSFLRVRKNRIAAACAMIEKFKRDLESLLDEDQGAEAVYQLNLQLFPITELGQAIPPAPAAPSSPRPQAQKHQSSPA